MSLEAKKGTKITNGEYKRIKALLKAGLSAKLVGEITGRSYAVLIKVKKTSSLADYKRLVKGENNVRKAEKGLEKKPETQVEEIYSLLEQNANEIGKCAELLERITKLFQEIVLKIG